MLGYVRTRCESRAVCEFQVVKQRMLPSEVSPIYSSSAAWKRLTNNPPPLDERISLVTGIFSDYEETEVVRLFCGENSQHLVEVVDEVYLHHIINLRKIILFIYRLGVG